MGVRLGDDCRSWLEKIDKSSMKWPQFDLVFFDSGSDHVSPAADSATASGFRAKGPEEWSSCGNLVLLLAQFASPQEIIELYETKLFNQMLAFLRPFWGEVVGIKRTMR